MLPKIPGYTDDSPSLAAEWQQPPGDYATELWPSGALGSIEEHPTGWLVVEEHDYSASSGSSGVSTFLTSLDGWAIAADHFDWDARYLGDYSFDEYSGDETGLAQDDRGIIAEFFVDTQSNHGLKPRTVDVSLPFQWFWNAMRDGNNWSYLDSAGNEHPLVRTIATSDSWRVEVSAREFRRFLERTRRVAVIQYDVVTYANSAPFASTSDQFRNAWASFTWTPVRDAIGHGYNAFSRLLGKRLISGMSSGPIPPALDHEDPRSNEHPDYIIGVDPQTGSDRVFTSDPERLANYFGKNPEAPHYLTLVHFDQRVLNKYRDEPSKYEVTATRLSCLGLWSLGLGTGTEGSIQVYLGDLGRDLPWQERAHWKSYNVPPRGTMDESRFRRDFLAEWAGGPTTLEELRANLESLRQTALERLSTPVIRELDSHDRLNFERLTPPGTDERHELVLPVITLTKALVDAIDVKGLRTFLGAGHEEERGLALLESVVVRVGGSATMVQPFRALQRLRSSGGVAHWGGSEAGKVIKALGLEGMNPAETIEFLAAGISASLKDLRDLISDTPGEPDAPRTEPSK
ncbi:MULTISPECIES: hypothetical protein [unclassified Curtobacterium]|jgi:hypothetical protein|uniref:hypothetical protein n=1 Tax=unclassified Curtobacterium TaxID=257496 RepID=UPI0008DD33E1|nr:MULTISPECIES: hypothetical protein [unclassified Curtobacterium]MCT9622246.1 hypothetical protein [Curtobacterium sp. C2H10]OII21087.1 hypothetical protein BIV03_15640 [Curtobacterium sp. MCBA15_016]